MAMVTYDDRSFLIDGRRIWLVSGSVHYFRTPSQLWRDRLLKAKRAGLNCISTYVAWNFHEPKEGHWELTGDQDVVGFVRLARELGLYVILRPGPYIGADWDFGGLPGWLSAKSGMAYRTNNAGFMHYFDKYFRQVLPRLAELQVTREGNIILIQNENEYFMTTMPDRLAYLEFISQLFRRSGFEIPIINCNLFSDPPLPDSIESVKNFGGEVQQLKRLRTHQEGAPMLVTEFGAGPFDVWGQPHRRRDAREVARRALEILGCGAQFDYCMWHGGTNLGFWGGRTNLSQAAYQTTSYDCDAPLNEGGGLTRKYYLTKLVNMLASHMGRFFAETSMGSPAANIHDGSGVLNVSGPRGGWAIVTNNGRDDIASARVSLPWGKEVTVSLEPFGAMAVPMRLQLTESHVLDYANLMPLGFFGQKVLVLHGPVNWDGAISIDKKECRCRVPAGDEVTILEHPDLVVAVINSDLAQRTWVLEDQLVLGPRFVGESLEDVVHVPKASDMAQLSMQGQLTRVKVKSAPAKLPPAPSLGSWKRMSVCTEPVSQNLAWQRIARPADADQLGIHYGYLWYRLEVQEKSLVKRQLFFPHCGDRATVYLNGQLLGIWGRGEGATTESMPARFKSGVNVLTLLLDNLGRFSFRPTLGEHKGLYGHVYDAKPLPARKPKLGRLEGLNKRIIPRQHSHLTSALEASPLWAADLEFTLRTVAPIHLRFADVPHHVAVLCNERMVELFPWMGSGGNFGDVTLGAELVRGRNTIRLLIWGDLGPETLERFQLHLLSENISAGATWSWRAWEMPVPGGHVVGKDQPAWYVTQFRHDGSTVPLFLHIIGAKKGQIFLNGHNIGRFWTVGPQQHYYLPSCWLAQENELLIFEELGYIPANSSLVYRPDGPYGE